MTNNKEAKVNLENQTATVLAQAVAEEMGEIPEVSITIEELKALERADRKKRNRKKAKIVGVAAALLIVCGVAAYAAWADELAVPVDADKNTEQSVQEENGSVVINENGAESEGATTYTETDWNKAIALREEFPDLMIPNYVPEGYEFMQLEVEHYVGTGYKALYKYQKESSELLIEENTYQDYGEKAPILAGTEQQIETKNGKGYILDEKNGRAIAATVHSNEKSINVKGNIEKSECIKIINKIDMGLSQKP